MAPIAVTAPVPVVEDIAPAPAVSYAAFAPVGEYPARAPALAACHGYIFGRVNGRCVHGLSPEFHREGVHWVLGRLVRLPTHLRRGEAECIVNEVGVLSCASAF